MKCKKSIFVFLLVLALNITPIFATWVTIPIEDHPSDQFQTESGNVFDEVDFLTLKDPNTEVKIALRFRSLNIDKYSKINGANLSVETMTSAYPFDADSSVTVFGFDVDNVYPFPSMTDPYPAVPPWGLPLTSAFTIWNTSQVLGPQVRHNVTVTAIVEEIIGRFGYVKGNPIGFLLVSNTGEQRAVYASEFSPYRGPILYIEYDRAPVPGDTDYPDDAPPADNVTATFTNQTISGLDIWNITYWSTGPKDAIYGPGNRSYFYYRVGSGISPVLITQEVAPVPSIPTSYNARRQIVRASGIIYAVVERVDVGARQVYLANSTDNGLTWNIDDQVSNFTGMNGVNNHQPTIGIDYNGQIHVVWCANNGTAFLAHAWKNPGGAWSMEYIDNEPGMDDPNIFIDLQNDIHVSFSAKNASDFNKKQVYYTNNTGGTWKAPVRVSTTDLGNHLGSSVTALTVENGTSYVGISWTRWDQAGQRYNQFREKTERQWTILETWSAGTLNENVGHVMRYEENDNYSRVYQFINQYHDGARYRALTASRFVGAIWVGFFGGFNLSPTDQSYTTPAIAQSAGGNYYTTYDGADNQLYSSYYYGGNGSTKPHGLDNTRDIPVLSLAYSWSGILNVTWIAVDENGTTIYECETEECLIKLITGDDPDPDDPEPGEWSSIGGLDRFRIKMIMFVVGLIMLMGAPLFGFAMKPSASTWIGIFFSMICGWALLIATTNT